MDKIDLFNEIFEKTGLNPNRLNYLKNDLLERDGHLNGQLEKVRQWHKQMKTDPIGCPEIGILTNSIIENEIQLRIIDDELNRLEREKAKGNPTGGRTKKSGENRVLAFNNIDDTLFEIEKILERMNEYLFVNSNEKQWKQFLKGEQLTEPINLKKGITLGDIKYFLDEVERKGIWRATYATIEDIKAFWYGGRILTAKQISGAKTSEKINDEIIKIPPKHEKQIDEIIKFLD